LYAATQYGAMWYTFEPNSTIVGSTSTNTSDLFGDAVVNQCSIASDALNYTNTADCVKFRGVGYVGGKSLCLAT
jgi:hypothetical protein